MLMQSREMRGAPGAGAASTCSGAPAPGVTAPRSETPVPRYTTLLLDVDGTLLDFDEAERRGVIAVMEHFGVTPTRELVDRYHEINLSYWKAFERGDIPKSGIFGSRYQQFFSEIGKTVDGMEAERLYRQCLDTCAVLLDGALELCAYLKERYDLYVVTNGVSHTQYSRLALSGLDQYFTDIFVSEDAGSQKPQKEYFDYCFARIPEKDPAKMLLIGDSLTSDIRGGKNAGIDTCWVNPGGMEAEGSQLAEELKPEYVVHGLWELKGVL